MTEIAASADLQMEHMSTQGSTKKVRWPELFLLTTTLILFLQSDFYFVKILPLMLLASLALARIVGGAQLRIHSVWEKGILVGVVLILMLHFGVFGIGSRTFETWSWWAGLLAILLAIDADDLKTGWPGLAAALAGGFGLAQMVGIFRAAIDTYGMQDYASFFGLSNFTVELVAPLLPFTIYSSFSSPRTLVRGISRLGFVLGGAYLILAGSRAGWLAASTGMAVMLYFQVGRRFRGLSLIALLVPALLIGQVILKPKASDHFRMEVARATAALVWEHPYGIGAGWFPDRIDAYLGSEAKAREQRTGHRVMDPHNEFLRVAAEFGVVFALFLFLGAVLWIRKGWLLARAGNSEHLAAAVGWIILALVGFPGRTVSGLLALGLILAALQTPIIYSGTDQWRWRWVLLPLPLLPLISLLPIWQESRAEQLYRTGTAYIGMERPERAGRLFSEALSLDPYHRPARLGYTRTLFQAKQFPLALRAVQPLLDHPQAPESVLMLALFSALQIGDRAAVIDILNRFLGQIASWDQEKLLATAQQLYQLGLIEPVRDLMKQQRMQNDENAVVLYALSEMELGQAEHAVEILRNLVDTNEVTPGSKIALAVAMEKAGRLGEAAEYLAELSSQLPEESRVSLYQARVAWLQKDLDSATGFVAQALRRNPDLILDPATEPDPVFRALYSAVLRNRVRSLSGHSGRK